jgi:hypothetical protein
VNGRFPEGMTDRKAKATAKIKANASAGKKVVGV